MAVGGSWLVSCELGSDGAYSDPEEPTDPYLPLDCCEHDSEKSDESRRGDSANVDSVLGRRQ